MVDRACLVVGPVPGGGPPGPEQVLRRHSLFLFGAVGLAFGIGAFALNKLDRWFAMFAELIAHGRVLHVAVQ